MREETKCPQCGLECWTFCASCGSYLAYMQADGAAASKKAQVLKDTRSEDEIQQAIKSALKMLGYVVYDMSQGRPTRQTPGIPDLYVQGHGITSWIEVKKPGGRVSKHQSEFVGHELVNGGRVVVAYDDAEAVGYVEGLRREGVA